MANMNWQSRGKYRDKGLLCSVIYGPSTPSADTEGILGNLFHYLFEKKDIKTRGRVLIFTVFEMLYSFRVDRYNIIVVK